VCVCICSPLGAALSSSSPRRTQSNAAHQLINVSRYERGNTVDELQKVISALFLAFCDCYKRFASFPTQVLCSQRWAAILFVADEAIQLVSNCIILCDTTLPIPGLRIRILIRSGFNRVSGSGSGSRRAQMTTKVEKNLKVHVLKCWMASFES
jgi:hypothetical protein